MNAIKLPMGRTLIPPGFLILPSLEKCNLGISVIVQETVSNRMRPGRYRSRYCRSPTSDSTASGSDRVTDRLLTVVGRQRRLLTHTAHHRQEPERYFYGNCAILLHIWTLQANKSMFFGMSTGKDIPAQKSEVLQGTLDLMVLQVLDVLGSQHGYGIARRIEQVSEQVLQLNEGTVYTSLLRLQQRKWIASDWGISENNRKAKYYSITNAGRKQLLRETENWQRIAGVIGRLLNLEVQE